MASRWISALWTGALVRAAAAAGAREPVLRAAAQLAPDAGPDARVPEPRHLATWAAAMRELDDPGFPIAFGRALPLDAYDTLGLASKTAPNLGAALEVVARYLPIWTNTVRCTTSRSAADLVVRLDREGARDLGMRAANESAVAELLHALRAISAGPVQVRAAHFAHAAPGDCSAHDAHFGAPCRFASSFDGLVLAPAMAEAPLRLSDQGLSRYLTAALEARAATTDPTLVEQLRAVLADLLPGGGDLQDAARRLALSPRSLQRRLREAGTTFAAERTATRRLVAERLLAEPGRTVAEVAFLVGYTEPSVFHRAFKRWTGTTPKAWRNLRR